MFGSATIDIAIGMIFVFLLVSLIASTINEIILSLLNMRGKELLRGIKHFWTMPTLQAWSRSSITTARFSGSFRETSIPKRRVIFHRTYLPKILSWRFLILFQPRNRLVSSKMLLPCYCL